MVELIKYVCHEIDTDNDKHLCRDLCRTDYSRIQKCVNNRERQLEQLNSAIRSMFCISTFDLLKKELRNNFEKKSVLVYN